MPCALCAPDPELIRIPAKHVEPDWGYGTTLFYYFRYHLIGFLKMTMFRIELVFIHRPIY